MTYIPQYGEPLSCAQERRVSHASVVATSEADHEIKWMSPETFIQSTAHDFHKWAVRKAFRLETINDQGI